MHVGLERPDAPTSFLPQWPVKDHVGLGLCRVIAQLLASEFESLISSVSLDDLRDASVGRIDTKATQQSNKDQSGMPRVTTQEHVFKEERQSHIMEETSRIGITKRRLLYSQSLATQYSVESPHHSNC